MPIFYSIEQRFWKLFHQFYELYRKYFNNSNSIDFVQYLLNEILLHIQTQATKQYLNWLIDYQKTIYFI